MSEQTVFDSTAIGHTDTTANNITVDHFYFDNCHGYGFSTSHAIDSLVEKPQGYNSMLIPIHDIDMRSDIDFYHFYGYTDLYEKIYGSSYIHDSHNNLVCVNTKFVSNIALCNRNGEPEKDSYCYNKFNGWNVTSPNYDYRQNSAAVSLKPGQLLLASLLMVAMVFGFA